MRWVGGAAVFLARRLRVIPAEGELEDQSFSLASPWVVAMATASAAVHVVQIVRRDLLSCGAAYAPRDGQVVPQ